MRAARRRAACTGETVRGDVELFRDAYTAELAEFADAVRERPRAVGDREDARRALRMALASIESVRTGAVPRRPGTGEVP